MRIVVAGFSDEQVQKLVTTFPSAEFRTFRCNGGDDNHADAVVVAHRAAFDSLYASGFLSDCKGLRWVHIPGAGIETYFEEELTCLPFTITNGKIIQGPEVADHALALLLSLTRSVAHVIRSIPKNEIPRPIELCGKNAVIIGCGGIGMGIAERVHAFGMNVMVITEMNFPYVSFVSERYFAERLLEVLPRADAVFVSAPLTASTRKMLGEKALGVMKSTAYLINVSRGAIIDTDALVKVLEHKGLRGIGLDVTDPDPLPADHPLWRFENVIITPHIAGMSDGLSQRHFDLILTNIQRFLAGRSLINVVDKALGF